jgi:hypothetical protein
VEWPTDVEDAIDQYRADLAILVRLEDHGPPR